MWLGEIPGASKKNKPDKSLPQFRISPKGYRYLQEGRVIGIDGPGKDWFTLNIKSVNYRFSKVYNINEDFRFPYEIYKILTKEEKKCIQVIREFIKQKIS